MAWTGCKRACRQRGIPLGMEQDQERCLEVRSTGARSFLAGSRQGYDLDNDGPRNPGIGSREKGKTQGQQGFAHGRRSFQGEPAGPANRPEVGQSPAKRRDFRKEATPVGSQAQQLRFPHPGHRGRKGLLHFGAYGNACIDAKTGKILWKNDEESLWVMHENGPGSSPLIWDDLMIFHLDGSDKQNIVALYKDSGKIAWKTKRPGELRENPQLQKSYSTPIVETFNGEPILISCSADWVYGYDPRTGKELWKIKYGHLGFSNVARPVTGHGMIYLSTCFMKAEILAFRYEGLKTPELAWRLDRGPKMPSPILVGNELHVINDGGILTCVDALTGDLHWRERLDGEFSSSPTYAGGLLYFSDQAGVTTVIKPSKTFQVVSKNELDGTAHMASFAPLGKSFLVRTNEALYRIGSL